MKFYASPTGKAQLIVQETPKSNGEVLISGRFQRRETMLLANAFLRQVAAKLNTLEVGSAEMADLLASAEWQVDFAKTTESLLETPEFEIG